MKFTLVLALMFICFNVAAQDYRLELNGNTMKIDLDKDYEVLVNGKKVKLKFSAYDTLEFNDSTFSFLYSKDYKTSKQLIDSVVEQITILTAEGSGFLIQKYLTLSPIQLNETMLNEITKESIGYGYKLTREDYSRVLKSGQSIKVDKAVLTYKDNIYTYEVASMGKKDQGVLIMTILLSNKSEQGKKIIDMLWKSFTFK